MTGPIDPAKVTAMAGALAQMSELMTTVIEATTGYRARCEAAGFSPAAAEAMAVEYHRSVMGIITHQARSKKTS